MTASARRATASRPADALSSGSRRPPSHTSTTYARDEGYRLPAAHEYTRDDNPTYRAPERLLADLEGGADARLFASGMAAATAAVQALVRPGARLVASRAMYSGLRLWMTEWCEAWNVCLELVDATYVWDAFRSFPKLAKQFGVDVAAILDEVAPVQTSAAPKPKKSTSKKAKAA